MSTRSLCEAEWMRFMAHPVHGRAAWALVVLLVVSALWSGLAARTYRAEVAAQQLQGLQGREQAIRDASTHPASSRAEAARAVAAAHALGRSELAATRLPATGGLVLGMPQIRRLPTAVLATVESRYSDTRVTSTLTNPLLDQAGALGLNAIMVLLVPLAALALTAGMIQEDREQGVWRLVRAQCSVGLRRVFGIALAIRWLVVFSATAASSVCAFALDPGASAVSLGLWLLALAFFVAFWVLVGGGLSLLPVSAGAALTAGLGLWLTLTFAVPAALAWHVQQVAPMSSRLAAIVQLRAMQQEVEQREAELLEGWYARHPGDRPATGLAPTQPTWPVTFMPRFEEQERRMRPVMRRFDQVRVAQAKLIECGAWLSPPLALSLLADRLAGVDAALLGRYAEAIDDYEDQWRAFVLPGLMSYRGMTRSDMAHWPVFASLEEGRIGVSTPGGRPLWSLMGLCSIALMLITIRLGDLNRS